MALQWIPLPWCSSGSLGIGNSKTSPRDYAAIYNFSTAQHRSGADVLSKGCSAGLFVSPNSSCGLGLGTGGMSSVMQFSCWQFPAVGFLQTFCGCTAVPGGRKPAFTLPVCASLLPGTVALLPDMWLSPGTSCWECCAGKNAFRAKHHCLQKPGSRSLPALDPCSAGDRGLQGMLKTASSFFAQDWTVAQQNFWVFP